MYLLSVRLANDANKVFKSKYTKMDLAIVEYSIMCGQSTNKLQLQNLHFCMKLLNTLFKIEKSCKKSLAKLDSNVHYTIVFVYIHSRAKFFTCLPFYEAK